MSDEREQEPPGAADVPPAAGQSDDWPRLSDLELEVCLLATEPRRARSSARRAWDDAPGLTDGHADGR